MRNDEFIKIENVSYEYAQDEGAEIQRALNNVSLTIEKGSFVAIVGRNGSGKSTLARLLNALILPTEGAVFIDGMDTKDVSLTWDIRKTVGMVFQNPDNQLVSSVVEDDVAFGPENIGIEPAEIRRRVDDSLNAVGMYEHRKKGPHLLSGGQKQRIAIAGVIAMQPECIVFDEPTAMLDPRGRREIMDIITALHKAGKTIILITHFMEEAAMADRVIVMQAGSPIMDGTPAEIYSQYEKLEEMYIELPFAAELSKMLREKGLNVPADIINEEELAAYLCALK